MEQTVAVHGKSIEDLNYNATVLLGVISEQGKDIREIKVGLAVVNERLSAFERNVNNRFEKLENRFETLENRFGTLEQSVSSRFETQDKKLEQILLLLNTLTPKPGQGTI